MQSWKSSKGTLQNKCRKRPYWFFLFCSFFIRLKSMRSQNAESNVIRTYIDTILELPWTETSTDTADLKAAEDILNRDHSSLDKVKKRILEFLAVRFLKGNSKGSIICLCGPPGVGKTSLGKKYNRIRLIKEVLVEQIHLSIWFT